MATILTKKKDTSGAPSAGDLTNDTGGAELAVNTADKRLYTKDSGGNVVEIGINPTSITTGTLNTSGAVVFNDAGADVDFRVEGDTDANLLFVDASADAIGIGTNTPGARIEATASGAAVQILNRTTSDGEILQFEKAGTKIGAVSVESSNNLFIGATTANHAGLLFTEDGNNPQVIPMEAGSVQDAQVDLGDSGARFKDLYLSGSVFLGGTTSANALDDYEEGTWTPTDQSGAGLTFSLARGVYTKVGRVVTAHFAVTFPSTANASGIGISLPFTSANLFAGGNYGNSGCISYTNASGTDFQTLLIGSNSGSFGVYENGVSQTNASYSTATLTGTLIFITA